MVQGSRRDQKIKRSRGGRWSWTFKLAQKRSWVGRWSWATKVGLLSLRVVPHQQCNGHCPCDSAQARQLKQQLHSALVAGQWRGDTALTLPLFWRRSTVSPVFFGLCPQSSLHSFVPSPPPPPPRVPVPNKPPRFCGRKAKWSMDSSRTLLHNEAPPWLVVGDWASVYILRSCGLLFSWIRCLISDCFACWPFSTMLSQVFWREYLIETPELVWVPFPLLGLLETCQPACLQLVLSLLFDPFKICPVPVCTPLCLSRLHVWRFSTALKYGKACSTFCLDCIGGRSIINHMVSVLYLWWFPVWLAMPRSALCPALTDLSVPLLWGLVRSQWLSTTLWYSRKRWSSGLRTLSCTSVLLFPHVFCRSAFCRCGWIPRYLRWLVRSTTAPSNVTASTGLPAARLSKVHHSVCALFRLRRDLLGFKIQDYFIISSEKLKCGSTLTTSLFLHCIGCLLWVPWYFIYEPVICQCENLAGSILVRICQAFGVDIEEDRRERWSLW